MGKVKTRGKVPRIVKMINSASDPVKEVSSFLILLHHSSMHVRVLELSCVSRARETVYARIVLRRLKCSGVTEVSI
jgi:hypothetical protein